LWDSRAESPFNPASTKMVIRKLTGSRELLNLVGGIYLYGRDLIIR
jgi:hypothetical protein